METIGLLKMNKNNGNLFRNLLGIFDKLNIDMPIFNLNEQGLSINAMNEDKQSLIKLNFKKRFFNEFKVDKNMCFCPIGFRDLYTFLDNLYIEDLNLDVFDAKINLKNYRKNNYHSEFTDILATVDYNQTKIKVPELNYLLDFEIEEPILFTKYINLISKISGTVYFKYLGNNELFVMTSDKRIVYNIPFKKFEIARSIENKLDADLLNKALSTMCCYNKLEFKTGTEIPIELKLTHDSGVELIYVQAPYIIC